MSNLRTDGDGCDSPGGPGYQVPFARSVPGRRSQGLVAAYWSATHIPVVLLSAPAGYGKTTLLALWAERDERPFAWVTLEAGEFRSPWDDIELGHHYARSLSAWGLLIAASGVQYDGIARTLSFDPIADGRYPFTTGTAWGVATIAGDDVTLDVRGGRLDLASLSLRGRRPLPVGRVAAGAGVGGGHHDRCN